MMEGPDLARRLQSRGYRIAEVRPGVGAVIDPEGAIIAEHTDARELALYMKQLVDALDTLEKLTQPRSPKGDGR